MAVTNLGSAEYNDVTDPRTNGGVSAAYFRDLQQLHFTFTQVGAGDATSTASLLHLQKGRYWIFPTLSRVRWTAFGASRVLDIGLGSYTNEAGTPVSAAPTQFDNDIDVSSAGSAAMGSDVSAADSVGVYVTVGGTSNTDGLTLLATVAGGTIPDGAVIEGFLVVSKIA